MIDDLKMSHDVVRAAFPTRPFYMTEADTVHATAARILTEATVEIVTPGLPHGPGRCMYMAAYGTVMLRMYDIPAILQAGSMGWRFTDYDDGHNDNSFGYQWEHDDDDRDTLLRHALDPTTPLHELHAWIVVLGETPTLVDLSTGDLVAHMQALQADRLWTATPPPYALWTTQARGLPFHYMPSMSAIAYALVAAKTFMPPLAFVELMTPVTACADCGGLTDPERADATRVAICTRCEAKSLHSSSIN